MTGRRALAAVVFAGLALAGCAGQDPSEVPPTTTAYEPAPIPVIPSTTLALGSASPVADDAYVTAANAACAKLNSASAESVARFDSGDKSTASLATFFDTNATLMDSAVAELRALAAPPEDSARLESAYGALSSLAAAARTMAAAASQGDTSTVTETMVSTEQPRSTAHAGFSATGLSECARFVSS